MKSLHILPVAGLFMTCILATAANTASGDEKRVHIFILSGQSNMAGMNPKLGFEPEAKKLFPDATVVYFKVAQGGQPIRYWVKEWDAIAKKNGIDVAAKRKRDKNKTTRFYRPILQRFEKLLAGNPKPASVTFCWMQGERDARTKLDAAYAPALKQLIGNLRRDLKQPNMNFVIGRLSDFGKPQATSWQNVRKAQVAVANGDKRGAWVDCDDLNNKEKNGKKRDDLHYTKAGYELLGRRFARQAKALIEGKPPAKNGRPE